jgi:hypothetical protein
MIIIRGIEVEINEFENDIATEEVSKETKVICKYICKIS